MEVIKKKKKKRNLKDWIENMLLDSVICHLAYYQG